MEKEKTTTKKKGCGCLVSVLIILIILLIIGYFSEEDGYKREPLPENFTYSIISEKSDDILEKNEATVEISSKITEGQIATLADKIFKTKPKQRRFYISYSLNGVDDTWAISNFDPDLKIQILGLTTKSDTLFTEVLKSIPQENVIGKWKGIKPIDFYFILYKKGDNIYMKEIYNEQQHSESIVIPTESKEGVRYDHKEEHANYYIVTNNGELYICNSFDEKYQTTKM